MSKFYKRTFTIIRLAQVAWPFRLKSRHVEFSRDYFEGYVLTSIVPYLTYFPSKRFRPGFVSQSAKILAICNDTRCENLSSLLKINASIIYASQVQHDMTRQDQFWIPFFMQETSAHLLWIRRLKCYLNQYIID